MVFLIAPHTHESTIIDTGPRDGHTEVWTIHQPGNLVWVMFNICHCFICIRVYELSFVDIGVNSASV